jgi:hypothetical protein
MPWDDTLRLIGVRRAQICYLCSFKLCQNRLPPERPTRRSCYTRSWTKSGADELSHSAGRIGRIELGESFHILQCLVVHSEKFLD